MIWAIVDLSQIFFIEQVNGRCSQEHQLQVFLEETDSLASFGVAT